MNALLIFVKILWIPASVFLMAAPLALEFLTFSRDRENKISYKRFRIAVYALLYWIAVTAALFFAGELLSWLRSLPVIRWIGDRIAFGGRLLYFGKVMTAVFVNFGIGFLYRFCGRFVRIGLVKKDLITPGKKDGTLALRQKLERRVLRFFDTETWFFTDRVLKWVAAALSAVYALLFSLYLIPALFGARWLPYGFMTDLLSAGYLYPVLTLLPLWEIHFFLAGVRNAEEECPEVLQPEDTVLQTASVSLESVDEALREQLGSYYVCDIDLSEELGEEAFTEHSALTDRIAEAVENDPRAPQLRREPYLCCTDKLVGSETSLLINGTLFSEFSRYFLRVLSVELARGDNVIFVCDSDARAQETERYLRQGLSELADLYEKDSPEGTGLDTPIWRIARAGGEKTDGGGGAAAQDCSVLVTTLAYLCSPGFESDYSRFIYQTHTVVLTDTRGILNDYSPQLSMFHIRVRHMMEANALRAADAVENKDYRVRYTYRPIRYICFDDTRIPGLDEVLKNLLDTDLDTADIMRYSRGALVRCYNFEGRPDENGARSCPDLIGTGEEVGVLMNAALLCLAKGASDVTVFAEDCLPYAHFRESLASNNISLEGLRLNQPLYSPDGYSVLIVMDAGNNLPAEIRRYMAMVSEKPSLILVFSRPYMLRDYYRENFRALWRKQTERIPFGKETKRDIARKILIKANAGGISEEELLRTVSDSPDFKEAVSRGKNGVLREILEIFGISCEDDITLCREFFEYTTLQGFDENGNYRREERVVLRRRGELYEIVSGRDLAILCANGEEIPLPFSKKRIRQKYIAGQNLLHDGRLYRIDGIETDTGRINAELVSGGMNDEVYQYIQKREYRVDMTEAQKEEVFPTRHTVPDREASGVAVREAFVSVFRAPTEVLTDGYYTVDPHLLAADVTKSVYQSISDPGNDTLAKQTCRQYGMVTDPKYSLDDLGQYAERKAGEKGALMMSVRLCGQFGADTGRTAALAAFMLNELLHTMFPTVRDSVAVCPVRHGEEPTEKILQMQPRLTVTGSDAGSTDLELLIIEDCAEDLGVVSSLILAGDDLLYTLFHPIFEYLEWYLGADPDRSEKSGYFRFGADCVPAVFDFETLHRLAKLLGDRGYEMRFEDLRAYTAYNVCGFCGRRYAKSGGILLLDDGRKICKSCAASLVGNNARLLKQHLEHAKTFLESTYGIRLDPDPEVCFESTEKLVGLLKRSRKLLRRGADIPLESCVDDRKRVHAEYALPSVNLSELLVRELTHVWQIRHLPDLSEVLAEGHIALVGIQYLQFLRQSALAAVRTNYYQSTGALSGEGYRKLVRALLENPQYRNNPFRYLSELSGGSGGSEGDDSTPPPRRITDPEDDIPYDPEEKDRAADGALTYFYYSRLSSEMRGVYTQMLNAIRAHKSGITLESDFSMEEAHTVSQAIRYDHPELFWYDKFALGGTDMTLEYDATEAEAADLQKRIEAAIEEDGYLRGINDSMSAYDVAIRLHARLIEKVDYDSIALEAQKRQGGSGEGQIDYLRTICGVFLRGTAVCEGYARAMQYLLQKCGIEAAEVVGDIRSDSGSSGGAHAWNLVKLDGEYYHLDVTWDDQSNTVQTVKNTDFGFDYFCVTTEEIRRTRDFSGSPTELPVCTAVKCNYYYNNGLLLTEYDLEKIKEIASRFAGKHGFFTLKCASEALYEETLDSLCRKENDARKVLRSINRGGSYFYTYNKDIRTVTVYIR